MGVGVQNGELAILAALGLLASALYSIGLANRLLFGNVKVTYICAFSDVTGREFTLLSVLAVATLALGLAPYYVDCLFETSIGCLLGQ